MTFFLAEATERLVLLYEAWDKPELGADGGASNTFTGTRNPSGTPNPESVEVKGGGDRDEMTSHAQSMKTAGKQNSPCIALRR